MLGDYPLGWVWGTEGSGAVRPTCTVNGTHRRKLGKGEDDFVYIFTEPRVGYKAPKIDGYIEKEL